MKKSALILLAVISIIGCSKEEKQNNQSTSSTSIVGQWLYDTTGYHLNPFDQGEGWKDLLWEFKADGTYKGDYSFECFYGCDSSFYFYANWITENETIRFDVYATSDDSVATDDPVYFDLIKLSDDSLVVSRIIGQGSATVYSFSHL